MRFPVSTLAVYTSPLLPTPSRESSETVRHCGHCGADHAAVAPLQHTDFVILAVGARQVALLRIGPDRDVPHRAVAERILLKEPLLDEAAVLFEHLYPVIDAVADIDQPVIGDLDAMHGVGELLRHRRLRNRWARHPPVNRRDGHDVTDQLFSERMIGWAWPLRPIRCSGLTSTRTLVLGDISTELDEIRNERPRLAAPVDEGQRCDQRRRIQYRTIDNAFLSDFPDRGGYQ